MGPLLRDAIGYDLLAYCDQHWRIKKPVDIIQKDLSTGYIGMLRSVGGKMEPLGETREPQRATAQAFS